MPFRDTLLVIQAQRIEVFDMFFVKRIFIKTAGTSSLLRQTYVEHVEDAALSRKVDAFSTHFVIVLFAHTTLDQIVGEPFARFQTARTLTVDIQIV